MDPNLKVRLFGIGGTIILIIHIVFLILVHSFFQNKMEASTMYWLAAFLLTFDPLVILAAYSLGFYFGKVEARGWMAGADQMSERVAAHMTSIFRTRESFRTTNHVNNAAPPPQNVILFPGGDNGMPMITAHSGKQEGEIIDLD